MKLIFYKERIMNVLNRTKIIFIGFVISSLLILVPGCEKKGEAEKAGEKIDEAIKNTGDKMEELSENIKDAVRKED